jgi:hypothetical protein
MLARISISIKSAKQEAHSKPGVGTVVTARMWHRVIWYNLIKTSEECIAFIIKVECQEKSQVNSVAFSPQANHTD